MLDMILGAAFAVFCMKFNRMMTKPSKLDVRDSWESVSEMMEDFS